MIKIGEASFHTTRPADLAERVNAITGCSIEEVRGHLRGSPMPGYVARLVRPFLVDEKISLAELGVMIADAGVGEIAAKVAALYDAVPEASE